MLLAVLCNFAIWWDFQSPALLNMFQVIGCVTSTVLSIRSATLSATWTLEGHLFESWHVAALKDALLLHNAWSFPAFTLVTSLRHGPDDDVITFMSTWCHQHTSLILCHEWLLGVGWSCGSRRQPTTTGGLFHPDRPPNPGCWLRYVFESPQGRLAVSFFVNPFNYGRFTIATFVCPARMEDLEIISHPIMLTVC